VVNVRRGVGGLTHRVNLEIPWLARLVEVNDDLFVLETELLEGDVGAVGPGAEVVGIEDDLWGGHCS
jgi:hypothetical protein